MTVSPFTTLPADPGVEKTANVDLQASILATSLASLIEMGMASSSRSKQTEVGASEIGMACPRRLSYRHHGYPRFNWGDPTRLLVGIGVHLGLAEIFTRLNESSGGRYLVEYKVNFKGVPGTLDLYDRATATVVDWKTTSRSRLNQYAKEGPPAHYVVQANIYAGGLIDAGFPVKRVAIAFLPYDGALSGLHVWLGSPDIDLATDAVARYHDLANLGPSDVDGVPDRYCGYCDYFNPSSRDLCNGCPGVRQLNGGKQ